MDERVAAFRIIIDRTDLNYRVSIQCYDGNGSYDQPVMFAAKTAIAGLEKCLGAMFVYLWEREDKPKEG